MPRGIESQGPPLDPIQATSILQKTFYAADREAINARRPRYLDRFWRKDQPSGDPDGRKARHDVFSRAREPAAPEGRRATLAARFRTEVEEPSAVVSPIISVDQPPKRVLTKRRAEERKKTTSLRASNAPERQRQPCRYPFEPERQTVLERAVRTLRLRDGGFDLLRRAR